MTVTSVTQMLSVQFFTQAMSVFGMMKINITKSCQRRKRMKYLLSIICLVSLLGCEPECDTCEGDIDPVVMEIVKAAQKGEIVSINDNAGEVEVNGVFGFIPVAERRSAIATCPALGLPAPEYDWFCVEEDANGRVIAKDDASPTIDSIQVYDEYPSVAYPDPMTSRLFFSQDIYPNHWGGPYQAMRGQMETWSAAWGNARVDWCNHPVHGERCNQD